ncbi:hypothetical protein LTR62_004326 [Meristemomyces frigidus]|uniref:Calcineurin-like phosphoesterase domain-containing protein n=1 Tax=Meristemomyces frigidus TaxID=1508187 RepID=A0AAN7TE44_9PEZI|nr:hypothetical protein LTR62_004326 [Meristemomyces frigidus]
MSAATGDMQAFCWYVRLCKAPPVVAINENDWFPPKPADKTVAPQPCGKTVNVVHYSDWHIVTLDPRFDIGSEANCTTGLCYRFDSKNAALGTTSFDPSVPASRFGDLLCDSPPDLALSALADMRQNIDLSTVPFAIFTGDIVSHDQTDQASRALTEYEETVAYQTFKAQLGDVPLYATLGNHDSWPSGFNTPNSFTNGTDLFSWNYKLLSSLWQQQGWLDGSEAQYAASHYGAYAHTTKDGLRIISINSDFWYTPNIFNYYNYTNPDKSGILRFLTTELLTAEAADQRVWIIGHVPSGGSSAIATPSALFHSIVARFSSATIAGLFLATLTKMVDATTFSIMNGQVRFASISNSLSWSTEPEWQFEYDIRQTYDPNSTWPSTAPLNATFWDQVTREMTVDSALIERYLFLATKQSVKTPSCTGACLAKSICGIRSSNRAVNEDCNA